MITRTQFIERTKHSVPYPLGGQALQDFYDFLTPYTKQYSSVAVLLTLARLQEEVFENQRVLIFDDPKIQRAFKAMCSDLPQAFYDFTFKQ